jgi:hypothetical protein
MMSTGPGAGAARVVMALPPLLANVTRQHYFRCSVWHAKRFSMPLRQHLTPGVCDACYVWSESEVTRVRMVCSSITIRRLIPLQRLARAV